MEAAALAKRLHPTVLTVAKGAHFNTLDEDSLRRYPQLDLVLRGEIEGACRELGERAPLGSIAGITWRDADGRIVRNPDRKFSGDLDAIPYPARHLARNDLYRRPDTGEVQTTLVTNRGCPFHCVYCLANQTAGEVNRYRSVENVMGEIRECVHRHGIRNFLFRSDLFTQNKPWVMRLCQAIVAEGLDIEWACNSRVDTISAEQLRLDEEGRVLDHGLRRRERRPGHARQAGQARAGGGFVPRHPRCAAKRGSSRASTCSWACPGTPRESIDALSAYARALDPDVLEIFYPYPFPGTPLYRMCVEEGLLPDGQIPREAYDSPAFAERDPVRRRHAGPPQACPAPLLPSPVEDPAHAARSALAARAGRLPPCGDRPAQAPHACRLSRIPPWPAATAPWPR